MAQPPYVPGRQPPVHGQQGNWIADPPPSMKAPPWNPNGLLPGPVVQRGAEAWSTRDAQNFSSDGTTFTWLWQTPVFALRPGVDAAYGNIPSAVPINHEAALGLSIYLTVMLGTATGVRAPAAYPVPGMRVSYWEDGNNGSSAEMFRLTQEIEITDLVLSGGTRTTTPFGASLLGFTPCQPGLRYWQLSVQVERLVAGAQDTDWFIQGSLH